MVGLGASETASSAQNGAANVTRGVSINLRGIGSNATLVLFGGRRMPPAGTQGQITDISVIPAIALERVELVADGGSAIYGSDAVTGVLNLIPRRNFTGAESALRFGAADKYTDWTISQLFGTNWDSGHGMIAIERNQHSALRGYNRDFFTSDLRSRGGSDFRSQQCAPGTILVGTTPYAIPPGSTGTGLTASQFTAGTRNLCDNIRPRRHHSAPRTHQPHGLGRTGSWAQGSPLSPKASTRGARSPSIRPASPRTSRCRTPTPSISIPPAARAP